MNRLLGGGGVANPKLKFAMFFSKTEGMDVGHAILACIPYMIALEVKKTGRLSPAEKKNGRNVVYCSIH